MSMTPIDSFNITVIGAGVVGLSIAEELSAKYKRVLLIEKNDGFGQETSSRNSEVIHAGIYYPHGFLKASLCTEGNRLLYDLCRERNIPHKRIGKLIVAINDEECEQTRKHKEACRGKWRIRSHPVGEEASLDPRTGGQRKGCHLFPVHRDHR